MARFSTQQRISLTILVAALGYFVDVFDLQLFSIVRVNSLKSLGMTPQEITTVGAQLLNWQMLGMLLGGMAWGVIGDKKGRTYVLFGTILLYSLANIGNAFVTSIPAYAAARFLSGLGLAGEIGAGITLASELLPKNTRSYATTLILWIGISGPLAAVYIADAFDWRTAYAIGGGLGLTLLLFRISVNESGMFSALRKETDIPRGRLLMLLNSRKRLSRYLCCLAIGAPTWFVVGVVVAFTPEIGAALGIAEPVKSSTALAGYFIGQTIGSVSSGLLSQFFGNRKKIIGALLGVSIAICAFMALYTGMTASLLYASYLAAGIFSTWTMFMTVTAEQFGTNLRATASTTAPNFVRGSVIVFSFMVATLKPQIGYLPGVEIAGVLCFALALLALWKLPETFGRDLDFHER